MATTAHISKRQIWFDMPDGVSDVEIQKQDDKWVLYVGEDGIESNTDLGEVLAVALNAIEWLKGD